MTEASSPPAPKVTVAGRGRRRRRRLLRRRLGLPDLLDRRRGGAAAPVGILEPDEHGLDVGRRGDRRADLVAGHHRDVVDREHVRRVGHGHEQRAVAGERDRHGLVAPDRGRADELGRIGLDAVELEVEVVEAEPLGDGAGELVLGDGAGRDQDALGGRAGGVRHLDRLVHRLALDQPEVHDDVGQHDAAAAATRRRRDASAALGLACGGLLRGCPGGCRWVHGVSTAARITARGAVLSVQRSNDAAPCATRISSPVTTCAPRRLASAISSVSPAR